MSSSLALVIMYPAILLIMLVCPFVRTCRIYQEYLDYTNITELGVAALENNDEAVDDLIKGGCDVNYNGTGVKLLNLKYVYDDDEPLDEEYTYNYEEYDDENDFSTVFMLNVNLSKD